VIRGRFDRALIAGDLPARPGTLSITIGARTVTLDPSDPREKFDRDKKQLDGLLARMRALSQETR
jgi:hypothetical protein